VFIDLGGTVGLSRSVFLSNDANGSTSGGIANLGGRVQCDPTECLPICTICRDRDAMGTMEEGDVNGLARPILLVCALVALVILGGVTVLRHRHCVTRVPPERQATEIEMGYEPLAEPLLIDSTTVSHSNDSEWPTAEIEALIAGGGNPTSSFSPASAPVAVTDPHLDEAPAQRAELNMSFVALRSSPAPIFVVDTAMRFVLWSRGAV
jgi:hypothetical protein